MHRTLALSAVAVLALLTLVAGTLGPATPDVSELRKINLEAPDGLLGVEHLSYRVETINRHFHGRERWFGRLTSQTATLEFFGGLHEYEG